MNNLIWFRSDLRIQDNPALYNAISESDKTVKAVFIITEQQWQQHKWGSNKIGFVLAHVIELQESLAQINVQLDILSCDLFVDTPKLLLEYAQRHTCTHLFYNKEYELNEQQRDQKVLELFNSKGISCKSFDEQCLIPPGLILNKQEKPYTVFTPFKKACYLHILKNPLQPISKIKLNKSINKQNKNILSGRYQKYLDNPILGKWPAGEQVAAAHLQIFCENNLLSYKEKRDFPALDATSKLSAYLAVGAISIKTCFLAALHANEHIFPGGNANIMCWLDELFWRDFYRNIIFHYPQICKSENFNKKYDRIKWRHSQSDYNKWTNGQTGIPIIDAAMRQLVETGWMHNRLRMITAMFLTKHLLIDWRRGEEFFSQHLIDLDYGSNNGGWQWCASTGTDAVPYFRIFNPISQSEKFDPEGNFIRKYCPEIKSLDNKKIHNPSKYLSVAELSRLNYPQIMVDLSKVRLRALDIFKGNSNAD